MIRCITTILAILVLGNYTSARADEEKCKNWFKFFKGEWTYAWQAEEGEFTEKGEVKSRVAAKGQALINNVQTGDGHREVEIAGWQAQKKCLLFTGYSSSGAHWYVEYTEITDNELKGDGCGVLPDGKQWKQKIALTKKGDDSYEIRAEGTVDGEKFVTVGEMTRKK